MKRGESGLSLLIGVLKPVSMSSHDVVNACRRIYKERRVGHMGTLDPMASGVLPIGIGPATRLDAFMSGHDKEYIAGIKFGSETDTDDALGRVMRKESIPSYVCDSEFASNWLKHIVGVQDQRPPAYSAIKVKGERSYKAARRGDTLSLPLRTVEIYNAQLEEIWIDSDDCLVWNVRFSVSKGTYVRSLARDIGRELHTAAHLTSLERTKAGCIESAQCILLDTLANSPQLGILDPIQALGYRYFHGDNLSKQLSNGSPLCPAGIELYSYALNYEESICACSTSLCPSDSPLTEDEIVCALCENKLKALYSYNPLKEILQPACVFSTPISRH